MNNSSLIVQALGWTLLHSLWQGAIIFICLFVVLKAIGKGHAKIKYLLAALSMAGLFLWFINTWLNKWNLFHSYSVYKAQNTQIAYSNIPFVGTETEHTTGLASSLSKLLYILETYFPIIVIIYSVGLCFMLLRFSWGIKQIQNLRSKGLVAVDIEQQSLLNNLLNRFNIGTSVRLFFSERVNIPLVVGSIKPVILLPAATINNLSTKELETILMHELAHIIRHDYLVNIFQAVVETILFFNPFIWLISKTIRREREHCCDDIVLKYTDQPMSYAKALATLETQRFGSNAMAIAANGNNNQLFNRIKRIMEMKKNAPNYSYLAIIILIAAAIIFSLSHFNTAYAQSKKDKKSNTTTTTTSTTVNKHKIIVIDKNGNKKEYDSVDEMPAEEKENLNDASGDNNKRSKKVKEVIIVNDDGHSAEDNKNDYQAISKAMKKVNWDQIGKEMEETFSDTGAFVMAMTNMGNSMANIDLDLVMESVESSLESVKKTLSDPNLKKDIQKELDKAKKDIEKAKVELEKSRKEMNVSIRKMKKDHYGVSLADVDEYDYMIQKMAADGLLDKNNYEIEKKGGKLYIDGIKQSDEVYKKYADYFSKNDVVIKKKNKNVEIDK